LLASRMMVSITRLALYRPAAFACTPSMGVDWEVQVLYGG
jgi:hypothetical protein